MKKGILVALLIASVGIAGCCGSGGYKAPAGADASADVSDIDIGGMYDVVGKNPGGKGTYKGTLKIDKKRNDVYHMEWKTGNNYTGIGFRNGNIVSVGWGGSGPYGVVVYTIEKDGILNGTWTMAINNELGTNLGSETATPKK